ncbi:hypothetical protein L1887_38345 [Cichorium endivia]|nr:hypothetical protein L1887_38345 [Cichorium endivia]
MGKKSGKTQTHGGSKPTENDNSRQGKYDDDTIIFISMAQEHKEEGNKLFQKKDYEGAMSIYQKALKLLPKNHINVSYLHTNIASCYMQMGITEFPKAIHECNLALEVTPKYSKALLKRARCYEALDRLDLALKDVTLVLNMEPKNIMAMEIAHRVKSLIESKNLTVNGEEKSEKLEHIDENKDKIEENGTEDKLVVDEKSPKSLMVSEEKVKKLEHMDEKKDKFEVKETEDKLVVDEKSPKTLMVSEEKVKKLGHMDEKEDKFEEKETEDKLVVDEKIKEKKPKRKFAELFKNYVGFSSDSCLDLHEVGMKLYMEAMEDTLTSEESQELFNKAADKFQEMAALALFNCGNVYMSKARKRVFEKSIKDLYEWAQNEYSKAGEMYEEAVKIKPDFYEGFLALGHQEFEQAKVRWYYEMGNNDEIEKWDSSEVIGLYNKAEENMEKGMEMWEGGDKNEGGNMKSLIHVLWGTMLYERSSMEFKLGLPFWHECLEIAVEKFEVAGVSHTDIAVMIKNHCSNVDAPQGLGFDIDEIVQAWHEMYEVKRWQSGVPSFRLEPLLRRRVSKYFYALEHAH